MGDASTAAFLDRLSTGYRDSQILFTGLRLGVFEALRQGESSVELIARTLDTDLRGTRILLDALVALGVLEKSAGRYRNGSAARQHLLQESPQPRGAILAHGAKLYEIWARLDEVVRTGEPVPEEAVRDEVSGDAERFAQAMADIARESAESVAAALDLAGVHTLLDLGGGPGLYAVEFARRNTQIEATVLDRVETLEVTRRTIREAGLAERIHLLPGDALQIDWRGPYDLIFASNFLHIFGPDQNRRLVESAAAALSPGGRVVIKDFLLDPARTSPPGAALFAVNMLVNTASGNCYTGEEVRAWMEGAGLEPQESIRLTEQSSLAVGRKTA